MFYDILLNNTNTCPICDKEIIKTDSYEETYAKSCYNNCYTVLGYNDITQANSGHVIIREDNFSIHPKTNKAQRRKIMRQINSKIKYWKTNERYLMEILTRKA